jgi:hypothetical protein
MKGALISLFSTFFLDLVVDYTYPRVEAMDPAKTVTITFCQFKREECEKLIMTSKSRKEDICRCVYLCTRNTIGDCKFYPNTACKSKQARCTLCLVYFENKKSNYIWSLCLQQRVTCHLLYSI